MSKCLPFANGTLLGKRMLANAIHWELKWSHPDYLGRLQQEKTKEWQKNGKHRLNGEVAWDGNNGKSHHQLEDAGGALGP